MAAGFIFKILLYLKTVAVSVQNLGDISFKLIGPNFESKGQFPNPWDNLNYCNVLSSVNKASINFFTKPNKNYYKYKSDSIEFPEVEIMQFQNSVVFAVNKSDS